MENPVQSIKFWTQGIQELTKKNGGKDIDAWNLATEKHTEAAFMQPPVPSEEFFKKKFSRKDNIIYTPDALDFLQTAKNHDVKSSRVVNPDFDKWIFAIISLQTMSGYSGKGNYGIARMNSGYGSRPCIALVYDSKIGARWIQETLRLVNYREELLRGPWKYRSDGLVLTWLPPWDYKKSLSINELDPFFIEICRPVRLFFKAGRIIARTATSAAPRIEAKDLYGVLGDPWIPINLKDQKKDQSALTVGSAGFTPRLLRNLIFEEDYQPAYMQSPLPGHETEQCDLTASVIVRGQGTTDGFHHTKVTIPAKAARPLFSRGSEREKLANLSKIAINDAGQMQNGVLKPAVFSLLEGGAAAHEIKRHKIEITDWWRKAERQFASAWHSDFFPWLWRTIEQPDEEIARLEWLSSLLGKARVALNEAIEKYPSRRGRHYKAKVKAEGLFWGCLYKNFPELKEEKYGNTATG
jgi:CRISPR system Cascade subunit CasA